MGSYTAEDLERLRRRLYEDTGFWAEHCATIVDRKGRRVKLKANTAQARFDAALEAQRQAGKPMRAIVLKARKLGFSTWVQAKLMHRITQRSDRRALVVAQDKDTAGELFGIGERIWANLPPDHELGLKPARIGFRRGSSMHFGEQSRARRDQGDYGLDSKLEVDTANEVEAGRGYTYTELHCSEVAFWKDVNKMLALLNAVPDEPETLVVLESTANGMNFFQERWEAAESGESEYVPVFAAWHEDPDYRVVFDSPDDRLMFIEQIGEGPWGEDEPTLVEQFGCTPEQLLWRRRSIVDKCDSDLLKFKQEYPATPTEAFVTSGKQVFSIPLVSRVVELTRQSDPDFVSPDNPGPEIGMFEPERMVPRKVRSGVIDCPSGARWRPAPKPTRRVTEGKWRVWEHPDPKADQTPRYVVSVDPAEGELTTRGETAYSAIEVIDHRTRRQVAEFRSRQDWDEIALQAHLAANYYNTAVLVIEKTGGYGTSMILRIWRDWRYTNMFRQRVLDRRNDTKFEDRLGWDTNRATKPLVEDGIKQLLRENPEVFQSFLLAQEMSTYVREDSGKTGPSPGKFADLLMAFGNGQQAAQEKSIPTGRGATSTTVKGYVNPVTKV